MTNTINESMKNDIQILQEANVELGLMLNTLKREFKIILGTSKKSGDRYALTVFSSERVRIKGGGTEWENRTSSFDKDLAGILLKLGARTYDADVKKTPEHVEQAK